MKILLYNPDNGVTRNFMPHLRIFLHQSLTPKHHKVVLIDGNAKAMTREGLKTWRNAQRAGREKHLYEPVSLNNSNHEFAASGNKFAAKARKKI